MTRRRNVSEQAATAAIEQGCRILRLPTIRDRFTEIATAAEREQMTYLAGWPQPPTSYQSPAIAPAGMGRSGALMANLLCG